MNIEIKEKIDENREAGESDAKTKPKKPSKEKSNDKESSKE